MAKRKNEAKWIEKAKRWQINVQTEGVRRTFTSSLPGKKGKIEAERLADQWLENQVIGENTRCEILLDAYCEKKKATTSKTNYDQTECYVRLYIKPSIGNKRIGRITENDLQNIIDMAFAKGLAHKTLRNIRATLTAFIKYCRKSKATNLFPESLEIPAGAKKGEKHIATPNDLQILFSCTMTTYHMAVCEDHYIHAYRLAVLLGLRPGELLALKWDDIRDSTLRIRRSINDDNEITQGKNDNARRPLSIKGMAQAELEAQRAMLRKKGIISPYVFPAPDGGITLQRNFRRAWNRYCAHNGLTRITPYEIRHTYVSINDEMPDGLKKQAMGHSKNMDTEGTYGHSKLGDLDRIAEYSENAVKKIIAK